MRIDPKELPLRHQEQLATAILEKITQAATVAVREEVTMSIKRPVRKFVFVNHKAASRFRILSKQEDSGAICKLICHKNAQGLIDCFTYSVQEDF